MAKCSNAGRWVAMGAFVAICAAGAGCESLHPDGRLCASHIPRELSKVNMPVYRVEPPDILLIDAWRVIPKPPYRAQPLDVLLINVPGVGVVEPIAGPYQVTPEGYVVLGLSWG